MAGSVHDKFMALAIEDAYRGIRLGHGGPFGAVIVHRGRLVASGHNEVLKSKDPTRHAEMCAITRASKQFGQPHFRGARIYSTTEPCVMCFAAIHWAQVADIYFGTTVTDVKRLGFNELTVSNRRLVSLGKSPVRLHSGLAKDACARLLADWTAMPSARTY